MTLLNKSRSEDGFTNVHNLADYSEHIRDRLFELGMDEKRIDNIVRRKQYPDPGTVFPRKVRVSEDCSYMSVDNKTAVNVNYLIELDGWDKLNDKDVEELIGVVEAQKSLKWLNEKVFLANTYDGLLLGFILTNDIRTSESLQEVMEKVFQSHGTHDDYPVIVSENVVISRSIIDEK